MNLTGKRILLGVSGSIAAYKAADLCSQLSKLGADVHVVLTPTASRFVGVPTFRALSRNPVLVDLFDEPESGRIAHIDLAQSADLVIVAPASANLIAKMALGLADDMLSTCLLATPPSTPLLVAPAMNTVMWDHAATIANVRTLVVRGVQFVEPEFGMLACQDVGTGKLAEVETILKTVEELLTRTLEFEGEEFVVTAGATREPLDPVRFLSNRSSGRMGYAIAEEAVRRGASVTLISGPSTLAPPPGVQFVRVETAAEMLAAALTTKKNYSVFIGAAAVADYSPEIVSLQKIKKPDGSPTENDSSISLKLRPTTDILAAVGRAKRPGQLVIGFAAETEDLITNARRKLQSKDADLIVANDVTMEGAGFDVDTNVVSLVGRDCEETLPLMPKREVAVRLLNTITRIRDSHRTNRKTGNRK